jgi:hypothetical protein
MATVRTRTRIEYGPDGGRHIVPDIAGSAHSKTPAQKFSCDALGLESVSGKPHVLRPTQPMHLPGFRVSLKTFVPGQKLVWSHVVPGRLCVMTAGEMVETEQTRQI